MPEPRDAILHGKASLLWSGVVKVERRFKPMDVISIADPEGREIARGIANHGSEEAELQQQARQDANRRPTLPEVSGPGNAEQYRGV